MARKAGRAAIVALGLLIVHPLAAASHPETLRAFVARIYRPYLRAPEPLRDEAAWFDRGLLSSDLHRLVRLDARQAHGEEGHIDADPICACQDHGRFRYRIVAVRGTASRRLVSVRLRNWGRTHALTLVIVPNGRGGLAIDDLVDDVYRPSFKAWLANALHR